MNAWKKKKRKIIVWQFILFVSCTTPCQGIFSTAIHRVKTSNLPTTRPLMHLKSSICFCSPIASRRQGKARWSWCNFLYDTWAKYTQKHLNFQDDRTVFNAWQFLVHLKRLSSFFTNIWINDVGESTKHWSLVLLKVGLNLADSNWISRMKCQAFLK